MSKTNTGICYWTDGQPTETTSVSLSNHKDLGSMLREWKKALLLALPDRLPFDPHSWVAYERAWTQSAAHREQFYGMVGVLRMNLHGTRIVEVSPAASKKALTGNGKASKMDMLAAARVKYPHLEVANHDEADALAHGLVALRILGRGRTGRGDDDESEHDFAEGGSEAPDSSEAT